jgi:hypothetical protein
MNNLCSLPNDEARPETDVLLHDYFQAQLPHSWPTFKTPKPTRMKQPASFWSRYSGRLALAACVALLVAGYLTLGGFFPRSQAPTGVQKAMDDLGHKEKYHTPVKPKTETPVDDAMPMPMGNETTKSKSR